MTPSTWRREATAVRTTARMAALTPPQSLVRMAIFFTARLYQKTRTRYRDVIKLYELLSLQTTSISARISFCIQPVARRGHEENDFAVSSAIRGPGLRGLSEGSGQAFLPGDEEGRPGRRLLRDQGRRPLSLARGRQRRGGQAVGDGRKCRDLRLPRHGPLPPQDQGPADRDLQLPPVFIAVPCGRVLLLHQERRPPEPVRLLHPEGPRRDTRSLPRSQPVVPRRDGPHRSRRP